jgi:LPXTG-motif cell wall-anchored protein
MMKSMVFAVLVLLGVSGYTSAAKAADCSDVTYTNTLLATNPEIGEHCLKVVERNGGSFVKLKAKVVRQSAYSTIVQWQSPDGTWSESDFTYPAARATAEIGGKVVNMSDLAPKQAVNVYIVQEGNWMIVEAEPMPVRLPNTATRVPLFALLGGLLILLGGVTGLARRRS